MLLPAAVFVSVTLLGLTSATPLSTRATCSPPAASNVSFQSFLSAEGPPFNLPAGPAELGIENDSPAFPPGVLWVPLVPVGPWTLLQSGSQYLIQHVEFPGKFLTSVLSAGSLDLENGPVGDAQKWNITCTTCPSDGFATDCIFANNPFPNTTFNSKNCIMNDRLLDLGNFTVTTEDCSEGTSFAINYHV
ncbi:hypothetical protein MSAN_01370600 [Mycena sanguinolenta]|uniref:Uncharacterized protein n=1 Tax=Mycena sanguinolenta TaxID=230812 RepID=A0A8H6YAK8_9AGAR|nr:hypothetical protein MSAN_01370600 [Mycena sanguinolenta]